MCEKYRNQYQWHHTENALAFVAMFVTKTIGYHRENLHEFFLKNTCFATEKYDGTNIAKDDKGQVYSRRLMIDDKDEEFLDTNLRKVREANIAQFRNRLLEVGGLDANIVSNCVVYGEFICNAYYDYSSRSIIGDWKVFGAAVEVKRDANENMEKLIKSGFAAAIKSSNKHHIQLFINDKFVEVAKSVNLDVAEIKGNNESIAKVVEKNKDDMKKGLLEGVVLTIHDNGYKVIKWKGAQEYQPIAVEKFLTANERIQKEDVVENLKTMFGYFHEVITDISENKHAIRMAKKTKHNIEKDKSKPNHGKQYLTNLGKEMIHQGILHSQKKFDSVEKYQKNGGIEEYVNNLIKEVKKHLAEEKSDVGQEDENINAFVTHKVNAVIKSQLKTE